jgi:phospholipase C
MRKARWRWALALGILGPAAFAAAAVSCDGGGGSAIPRSPQDDASGPAPADGAVDATGDASLLTPTPIDHVVVLVKENRTFDNLFGLYPGADGAASATLSTGEVITRPTAPVVALPRDISHSHGDALTAYAGGKMNGFDLLPGATPADGGADDRLPFLVYGEDEIPNYYRYAREFVLCDRFFSTTLGPTFPGHLATVAAQSPAHNNPFCPADAGCPEAFDWGCTAPAAARVSTHDEKTCASSTSYPCFDIPSIVDSLPIGMSWRAYGPSFSGSVQSPFAAIRSIGTNPSVKTAHLADQQTVVADFARGDQPNLTYINVSAGEVSEHPPEGPCLGENFTVQVVNAVMNGPFWQRTAIVITWDDWGGLYDHVAPLVNACPSGGEFFHTGFRVPALVISPYAKRGYIKHGGAEQASIPRLVAELFGLPRMSARDPNARDSLAGSLLDAFDFSAPPRSPLLLQTRTCP